MTATMTKGQTEAQRIEAEAEQLTRQADEARARLQVLREEQERRKRERLTAWAQRVVSEYPAENTLARTQIGAASSAFEKAIAEGDLAAVLKHYARWDEGCARALVLVRRRNTAIQYLPEGTPRPVAVPENIVPAVPSFMAAFSRAVAQASNRRQDDAKAQLYAEYEALKRGEEA